jgi:hypothetical protein
MRKAPEGLHDALDQLVNRMAEENQTYGQARVTWVGEAGEPDLLTLLTVDLDPPKHSPQLPAP